jgi:hypothetical protein
MNASFASGRVILGCAFARVVFLGRFVPRHRVRASGGFHGAFAAFAPSFRRGLLFASRRFAFHNGVSGSRGFHNGRSLRRFIASGRFVHGGFGRGRGLNVQHVALFQQMLGRQFLPRFEKELFEARRASRLSQAAWRAQSRQRRRV